MPWECKYCCLKHLRTCLHAGHGGGLGFDDLAAPQRASLGIVVVEVCSLY